MGILNIGTQALQANLIALQTVGNNIANVNTPGYSRQSVVMEAVQGQFSGGGYVGKGVAVQTIQRNFDTFLNQQAVQTSSVQAADQSRATQLTSLENLFPGGTSGLGQAISDMLNSFSDVASAPADLTARTVALTNVDETASRMRDLSSSLDALQSGISQPLGQMVTNVNTIAANIATVNGDIAAAQGNGQPPNDLLDKRDQLISDLNQLVQTTQIPASDGTVGVFIGGSQALVLGTSSATMAVAPDPYGDPLQSKVSITNNGSTVTMDENTLGGGQIAGMLKFQNTDLNDARNMLGRLTLAVTTAMNNQHQLGLDMNGNPGGNLFTPTTFGTQNILPRTSGNTGTGTLGLSISDLTKFVPSDYQVDFSSATSGTIKRISDGVVTAFPQTPPATAPALATVDGLNINLTGGTPAAGDSYLIKPFNTSASNVQAEFSSPRSLAVASPIAVNAASTNQGSLTVSNLTAQNLATPSDNYSINFTVSGTGTTYDVVDTTTSPSTTVLSAQPYVPGQAISYAPPGVAGFSLTLTGSPSNGDSMTVGPNPYTAQDGGNATALMNLRDVPMFDGAALTDGYAAAIAQLGIRSQSANYSAQVSTNLATTASSASSAVSGVNLDEEAAKLLQYQQAYQASSKMIQIAQSIFESLIQGLS